MRIALQYIQNNYKKNISRHDILSLLNINNSQLTKLFKTNLNITFTEYINSYRITKGAALLNTTNLSTTNICYECGFDDLTYFIRVFKKKYNVSPSKYRKLYFL